MLLNHSKSICCGLILFLLSSVQLQPANAYSLAQRWDNTATNGGGLNLGDPTTITWSIMPDGSNIPGDGLSNLINFLDTNIGAGPGGADLTQRPWFAAFEQSFARWDELSGVTYVYETNDDGVNHASLEGVLGVRGDVRIGGTFLDGNSGVLAYDYFPDNSDMALDTGDVNFYSNTSNNSLRLRNVIMHEAGHGLGYAHIESDDSDFLMEPFINLNFDGPQMDEIRGIHRGYGDRWEESGGNDTIGSAIPLGAASGGLTTLAIGTDGSDSTFVAADDIDFVSIDDNGDTDYYSFTVDETGTADFLLSPKGPTYFQGVQGGNQSSFNAKETSNLTLAVYDSNQALVTTINDTDAGGDEVLNGFDLDAPGTYYARVTGSANNVQLYTLTVDVSLASTGPDGDFDDDGNYACSDVNALVADIASGANTASFDLTGDGLVTIEDLDVWRAEAGEANLGPGLVYLEGDADLSGFVDGADFVAWNASKFTDTAAWCAGDFNANGFVDGADWVIWNANKFLSSANALNGSLGHVTQVPEPASAIMVLLMGGLLALRRRSA